MGRSSFEIYFYAKKDRGTKIGKWAIMARISANGFTPKQMGLQLFVTPSIWNPATGRAEGRTDEARELNAALNGIQTRFNNLYKEFLQRGEYITPQRLKDAFQGKTERQTKTLLSFFNEKLEQKKQRVKVGDLEQVTVDKYVRTLKYLKAFIKKHYGFDDMEFERLRPEFIELFELYLLSVRKMKANSAAKHLEHLKWTVTKAFKNGFINYNIFDDFSIRKTETKKEFLTQQELGIIMEKDFCSERMNRFRDVYIFCCFTGVSYADAYNLTRENLSIENDGYLWLTVYRDKTEVKSTVQLMDVPLAIIEKYADDYEQRGRLLPIICNQKCNEYLKEIMTVCLINKHLTFHTARYTFATTIMLENDAPLNHVQRGLGHRNIKQTQHYAKLQMKNLSRTMVHCNNATKKLQNIYLNRTEKSVTKQT